MMEVLVALILLGIISLIFVQTTGMSLRNTGRSTDWQQEAVVIEKTIENLRRVTNASALRALDSSGVDRTNDVPIRISVRGSPPPAAVCPDFDCPDLVQVHLVARRETINDSVTVSTFLFAKSP